MYVCMYECIHHGNISPSIPVGEHLTAMERSMAGKGTTRDGLNMEQQVFMGGYTTMYVCKAVNGKV